MRALIIPILSLLATSCSPYDPSLPGAPFKCGEGDACPSGYTCSDDGAGGRVCLTEGGELPDAGSGNQFQCADQAAFEPNDSSANAYATTVGQSGMITFGPISICPEADKDYYKVVTTSMSNLEVITWWEDGDAVKAEVWGSGVSPLAMGTATTHDDGGAKPAMRACVSGLAAGTYFGVATSSTGEKQNYKMSIKLVTGC